MRRKPLLLRDAVLNDCSKALPRPYRCIALCGSQSIEGELLDLESDHITATSEIGRSLGIVPGALKAGIHDKPGWTGGIGIHHLDAIAE